MLCKCLSSGMTWMLLLKISHQLIRVKDMQWLSYLYISEGGFIPTVDISSLRTLTGLGQRSWVVVVVVVPRPWTVPPQGIGREYIK